MKRVMITGANGFIGQHLSTHLLSLGQELIGCVRRADALSQLAPGVTGVVVGEVGPNTEWGPALRQVHTVVHLVARAHVIDDRGPLEVYRTVNVEGTERLIECSARQGVKRLVFVSSVKATGEGQRVQERAYREADPPYPKDAYGISKAEAEKRAVSLAERLGIELVILRPPLVYGEGVPGNFARLIRLVDSIWPIPLASVRNRRSMVYVGNFVDALATSIHHPGAASETFFVADSEVLSTPEMIGLIAQFLEKPPRLVPFPVPLLRFAGVVLGVGATVDRLVDSLEVDCSKIQRKLGWSPSVPCSEGIRRTVESYRRGRSKILA